MEKSSSARESNTYKMQFPQKVKTRGLALPDSEQA